MTPDQESHTPATKESPTHPGPGSPPRGRDLAVLSLAALGIVYGDIGTSPLYALRQAFRPGDGVLPTAANILGILSLIFWALVVIISIKYLAVILRADNRGEGGILALTSLVTPVGILRQGRRRTLILLGLFGTALLYGDGMITPAISVLSAVEGIEVATPGMAPFILPITVAILIGVFAVQQRGTAGIGRIFGPVTLVWFAMLAAFGLSWIVRAPGVLLAVNPLYGVRFFMEHGWTSFFALGAVFLAVTGGEALYADMGHFGRRPIRLAWFAVVLPALLLNYFGQGALLLLVPDAVENPFYRMAPTWALYPTVVMATFAAIIASQALISGSFSMTRQAVQLGYLPRLKIEHTSARQIGQIYVPSVNWGLMCASIALVFGFRTSGNLAAAYGVSVSTTMVVTTLLLLVVARERWRWPLPLAALAAGSLLLVDVAFWAANLLKVPGGGWFPLAVGVAIYTILTTWKTGRRILTERLQARALPRELFVSDMMLNAPPRVRGTAVFMDSDLEGTPPALLHNLKHNQVLHERVVLLSVITEEVPYVSKAERVKLTRLGAGIFEIVLHVGFMESLDVPEVLSEIREEGLDFRMMTTSFFLSRETIIPSQRPGMAIWRERLFAVLARNARPASSFFNLPPNRVVEMGAQIEV